MNHYLAPKFFAYIGKDFTSPFNYNGKIGYINVNLGAGAFKDDKDLGHKDDVFGIKIGIGKLATPEDKFTIPVKVSTTTNSGHDSPNPAF